MPAIRAIGCYIPETRLDNVARAARFDRDVLARFQDEGPGWQERINAALRKAAGLEEG